MTVPYDTLATYAEPYLTTRWNQPFMIGQGEAVPDCGAAVYVSIDLEGNVVYVGSVCRPQDQRGITSRLSEHLTRVDRVQTWNSVYVFPLKEDTPLATVRRIEGRIGAHLRPTNSKRLPRLQNKKVSGAPQIRRNG